MAEFNTTPVFMHRHPGGRLSAARALVFLFAFGLLQAHSIASSPDINPAHVPPRISREFRAAWIATKGNIDWPSKPGLTVAEQKAELIALMDKAVQLRLNALIFQVRPACDALYKSSLEPWSWYLTGKMGQAPESDFDPLAFAVEQAHARNLELHAWFNPYRAGFRSWDSISPDHIIKKRPDLVRRYASAYWLDPGEAAVQDHTTRVILDVVRRYDIDAVHMDDYFYPYPEFTKEKRVIEFPDDASFKKYRSSGGKLERDDWRRQNVNKLVQRLHTEIKREKPWVQFGISPFGIWRPGFPKQVKGLDAYQHLFADARLWLMNGWVDYLAPQLYWAIDPPAQSFPALLKWWHSQNPKGVSIWPGGAVTHVGKRWKSGEILRQIDIARNTATPGYIHWNISSLVRNADQLADQLATKRYAQPALVPAARNGTPAPKPILAIGKNGSGAQILHWETAGTNTVSLWVVQTKTNGKWRTHFFPAATRGMQLGASRPTAIAVSSLDRFRALSPAALIVP